MKIRIDFTKADVENINRFGSEIADGLNSKFNYDPEKLSAKETAYGTVVHGYHGIEVTFKEEFLRDTLAFVAKSINAAKSFFNMLKPMCETFVGSISPIYKEWCDKYSDPNKKNNEERIIEEMLAKGHTIKLNFADEAEHAKDKRFNERSIFVNSIDAAIGVMREELRKDNMLIKAVDIRTNKSVISDIMEAVMR